jgi:hypothetical protein
VSDFRCSAASRLDDEPMPGTAPTERAFLLVEYAGPWGRDAPSILRDHVGVPAGVRPQLIRRHRAGAPSAVPHLTVYAAWLAADEEWRVETTTVAGLPELAGLDLAALAEGRSPGLAPYDDLLWLVCTNGRRDLCCAEIGRPVTTALAARWPEQTWETTHLGGHRFAGTLLALPSGITLGRLDPATAVGACEEVAAGGHPLAFSRGRAGRPGGVQVGELALLERYGAQLTFTGTSTGVLADGSDGSEGQTTEVRCDQGSVTVVASVGPPRRQSCADLATKPTRSYRVLVES